MFSRLFSLLRLVSEIRRLRLAVERLVQLKEIEVQRATSKGTFFSLPAKSKPGWGRKKEDPVGIEVTDADLVRYDELEQEFILKHGRAPRPEEDLEEDL